jgi:short subunit dehydrogenase-like uncharacterized protein
VINTFGTGTTKVFPLSADRVSVLMSMVGPFTAGDNPLINIGVWDGTTLTPLACITQGTPHVALTIEVYGDLLRSELWTQATGGAINAACFVSVELVDELEAI